MEIKHVDGSITKTEDVKNDIDSMALEKAQELLTLFSQFNVPFVLRFELSNNSYCGAYNFTKGNETPPPHIAQAMLRDNIAFWERLCPSLKFVAIPTKEYNQLLDGIESPDEKSDDNTE